MNSRDPFEDDDEDDEDSDTSESELTLVFTSTGQCVLEEDGETVWTSDSDDDFQEEFGSEFVDADADSAKIINWLVEEGWIDEDEKARIDVETEEGTGDEDEDEDEF